MMISDTQNKTGVKPKSKTSQKIEVYKFRELLSPTVNVIQSRVRTVLTVFLRIGGCVNSFVNDHCLNL